MRYQYMKQFHKSMLRAPNKLALVHREYVTCWQSRGKPVYLVTEYPKCGGSWLKLMLCDALGLPNWEKDSPRSAPCVVHGHWLAGKGKSHVIVLYRDGRDVMVSWYYHSLFFNGLGNAPHVERTRQRCDFDDYTDIRRNLLPFMKLIMNNSTPPGFSWPEFVRGWYGVPNVVTCRYEDLRRNTAAELVRVVDDLGGRISIGQAEQIAGRHSMENMRKRLATSEIGKRNKQKAEMSFVRKGSVGGWSESFSDEALEWFELRAGAELQQLGYQLGRPE